MMTDDDVRKLTHKVLEMSDAEETEIVVNTTDDALTRFADNVIHQNVVRSDMSVTVRASVGKRLAESVTNKTDDVSLKETVDRAVAAALAMPDDESLLRRQSPQTYPFINAFDPAIATMTPRERATQVQDVVSKVKATGMSAAGSFSSGSGCRAVANSNGLFAFYPRTQIAFSITVTGRDGTGWADASGFRQANVEASAVGERALAKAQANQSPRDLEPGAYTAVLEPTAVTELLWFMSVGFNAMAVDEGRSWLSGQVGEKVLGDNINISSDVHHPLHQGCPFDAEGTPTQRVPLITNGVATGLIYDRLRAQEHDTRPTGHAPDASGAYGAMPTCLVFDGSEKTLDALISNVEQGLLVTRFWYNRTVDPMKVLVTGMTRDGLFWIENGRISHSVKNFRFNQSVIEMLKNVNALSTPSLAGAPDWESSAVVPALTVDGFHFTSVTTFSG